MQNKPLKNLKDYRIVKNELNCLYLPQADNIIKVRSASNNLKDL